MLEVPEDHDLVVFIAQYVNAIAELRCTVAQYKSRSAD
jgi:hypothetical protein